MRYPGATPVQRLGRLLAPLALLRARMVRGMTLGVRAAVLDGAGRVFLVKHTYMPGWYLPGGGIEPGETADAAMARELREEGGIELTGPARLHGLYWNARASARDHVAFYEVSAFVQPRPKRPDREIAASGFFPLEALPEDATPGTRHRIDELLGRRVPDGRW